MRPYYPFNNKLFNTTTHCSECPYINDTLNLRRVCVRDVNLVVAVLCQYRKFTRYRELHLHVGQSKTLRTVIFTYFFDSESGENSNFEGSRPEEIDAVRLRDHFDCDNDSVFDLHVGWNHNYSELWWRRSTLDHDWTNIRRPTSCRLWLCPDFDAEVSWIECIGDAIYSTVATG